MHELNYWGLGNGKPCVPCLNLRRVACNAWFVVQMLGQSRTWFGFKNLMQLEKLILITAHAQCGFMHRNPPLSINICSFVTKIDLLLSKSNNHLLAYTIRWCMLDQKWTKAINDGSNFIFSLKVFIHCSVVVVQKLELYCKMRTNRDNKKWHWTSPQIPSSVLALPLVGN